MERSVTSALCFRIVCRQLYLGRLRRYCRSRFRLCAAHWLDQSVVRLQVQIFTVASCDAEATTSLSGCSLTAVTCNKFGLDLARSLPSLHLTKASIGLTSWGTLLEWPAIFCTGLLLCASKRITCHGSTCKHCKDTGRQLSKVSFKYQGVMSKMESIAWLSTPPVAILWG